MRRPFVILVLCLPAIGMPMPASAALFCEVMKSSDGFVALRDRPSAGAGLITRMRAGDEVQLLEGSKGRWREVLHWRGGDRLDPNRRARGRHGWVHARSISECG
jgi:hypothetical protein